MRTVPARIDSRGLGSALQADRQLGLQMERQAGAQALAAGGCPTPARCDHALMARILDVHSALRQPKRPVESCVSLPRDVSELALLQGHGSRPLWQHLELPSRA